MKKIKCNITPNSAAMNQATNRHLKDEPMVFCVYG